MDGKQELKKIRKESRKQSNGLRKYILRIANNKCEICGWKSSFKDALHIHHIIPISDWRYTRYNKNSRKIEPYFNPGDEINNLIALCPNCHCLVHKIIKFGSEAKLFWIHRIRKEMSGKVAHMLLLISFNILRNKWKDFD